MGIKGMNSALLDTPEETEVVFDLLVFSGGENQISADHITQNNEARTVENWDINSIGEIQRSLGFTRVAEGAGPVTDGESVLGHHHYNETSADEKYLGVIAGDLVQRNGSAVERATGGTAAFTSGKVCMAADGGDTAWITNATDNLSKFTIAAGFAAVTQQPASAHGGIYKSKRRLIAEGDSRTVEYSRAGTGNWDAADTWTLANDAATIDLPDFTTGTIPEFPAGDADAIFTKDSCYMVFGVPNLAYRGIPGSFGCHNRHTLAQGAGGAFGFTLFPKRMIWFWDRTRFISLTDGVDWIDNVDKDAHMWAAFAKGKYYFFFDDTSLTGAYPNRLEVFDTQFNSWMHRRVNGAVSDNLGAPLVQRRTTGDIYCWSSRGWDLHQLETGTDDFGQDTQGVYTTRRVTSADFVSRAGGKQIPSDEINIKLTSIACEYEGQAGTINIAWNADYGRVSDSISFDAAAAGTGLGSFTLGTSTLGAGAQAKYVKKSVSNAAVGKRFDFTISNSGTGVRPKVRKVKVYGILLSEE